MPKSQHTTLIAEIRTSLRIKPNLDECLIIGGVALLAACTTIGVAWLVLPSIGFVLAFIISASVTAGAFVAMAVLTRRRAIVKVARIQARLKESERC